MFLTKPLNSILIKPAGPDCNMACDYCFYLKKAGLFGEVPTHRMNLTLLEETIRQGMEQSGRHVSFIWQGGEPTLMGLGFYRKVVQLQQKYGRGQIVANALQTNGLLLDQQWAEFLKNFSFLVGLSLDGPQSLHDYYRKLKKKKGTWQRVFDKGKMLLEHGVDVNIISVVTDRTAGHAAEIYNFFKNSGFYYLQFVPCLEFNSGDRTQPAPFSVSAEDYGRFLVKLFDLWMNDFDGLKPKMYIRFFESLLYVYMDAPPPLCTLANECGNYVVVEHNGNVYSCDFFVESDCLLGNIRDANLIDMLNCSSQRKFGENKGQYPKTCGECRWLRYCCGGCPKDRDLSGNNYFCQSYKMFFEHAHKPLTELAEKLRKQSA